MTFRAGALVFGFFILGISAQAQAICIVFGPGLCAVSCRGTNDEITAELIHDASANEKACALTFAKDTTTLGLLLERGVDINTQTTISYKNWPAGAKC